MSFLARTTIRRAAFAPRAFSTSFALQKTPVETTKDALKSVDRTVSDKLVDGIEAGQAASQKVKEVAGVKSGEAKGKAAELTGEAKGKAAELKGEAKAKASEISKGL